MSYWYDDYEGEPETGIYEQQRREHEQQIELEREWLRRQPELQIVPVEQEQHRHRIPTPGQIQSIIDSLDTPAPKPSTPLLN